jgi:hypothetical protein
VSNESAAAIVAAVVIPKGSCCGFAIRAEMLEAGQPFPVHPEPMFSNTRNIRAAHWL